MAFPRAGPRERGCWRGGGGGGGTESRRLKPSDVSRERRRVWEGVVPCSHLGMGYGGPPPKEIKIYVSEIAFQVSLKPIFYIL